MNVTVKIKRPRRLSGFASGRKVVKVGFPAGMAAGSVIERAIYNEFGTRGGASGGGWGGPIPERPFMRNAMRNNLGKYEALLRAEGRRILVACISGDIGPTALISQALSKIGIAAQADVQGEISSLMSPPLSPVTIARKGSSKPLIDSGAMRSAVTYLVEG